MAIVIGAVAGYTAAAMNYNAAKKSGLDDKKAGWSASIAFLVTFAATAAAAWATITFPGAATYITPFIAGGASAAINIANQLLDKGKVNWDRAGSAFLVAAITDLALGQVFSALGAGAKEFRGGVISTPIGTLHGTQCGDYGFGNEYSYYCGTTIHTDETSPKSAPAQ